MPEYITPYEMSKRLNGKMHESYIRLLCDQGVIEHSEVPNNDARCKNLYLIPSKEIDILNRILTETKKTKDLTVESKPKEQKYLTSSQVCQLTGKSQNTIWHHTVKTKKLKGFMKNGKWLYLEDDVLAFMEENEKENKKKGDKKMAGIKPAATKKEDCIANDKTLQLHEQIQGYKNLNNNLQTKCDKLENECKSYKARIKNLGEVCDKLENECKSYKARIKNLEEERVGLVDSVDKRNADFDKLQKEYEFVYNKLQKMIEIENEEGKSFFDGYEKCKQDLAVMLIQKKGRIN